MTLFDSPVRNAAVHSLQKKMLEGIGEGWNGVFAGADEILYRISDELYRAGGVICPGSGDVFRAFKECKFSVLKVVWVLQDPYHQVMNGIRVADGIAMSCRNTGIAQPSLKLVQDEMRRTVQMDDRYKGIDHREADLTYLANQGILMLNTALTVAQAKPGSHTEMWRPFTQYLLRKLGEHKDIVWVFSGAHAKSFSNFVKNGTKYYTVHPAAAAYRGGHWDSDDLFNNINYALGNLGVEQIKW